VFDPETVDAFTLTIAGFSRKLQDRLLAGFIFGAEFLEFVNLGQGD